jgi:hypothetical protein
MKTTLAVIVICESQTRFFYGTWRGTHSSIREQTSNERKQDVSTSHAVLVISLNNNIMMLLFFGENKNNNNYKKRNV